MAYGSQSWGIANFSQINLNQGAITSLSQSPSPSIILLISNESTQRTSEISFSLWFTSVSAWTTMMWSISLSIQSLSHLQEYSILPMWRKDQVSVISTGIPSSCSSFLLAAFSTPFEPTFSETKSRGWLQQLFAHTPGNVIFSEDLFWTKSRPSESKISTLKARCLIPPSLWQTSFVSAPMTLSSLSTTRHISPIISACIESWSSTSPISGVIKPHGAEWCIWRLNRSES